MNDDNTPTGSVVHLKPRQPITLTLHNAFDPKTAYQRPWVSKHLSEARVKGLYFEMGWAPGSISILGMLGAERIDKLLGDKDKVDFTLQQHLGSHVSVARGVNPSGIPVSVGSEGIDVSRLGKDLSCVTEGLTRRHQEQSTEYAVDWINPNGMSAVDERLTDMLNTEAPKKVYLIEDFLGAGETAIFIGETKSGKSFFLLQLAIQCAVGGAFFRCRVKEPVPVVYLNAEDPIGDIHYRVKAICDAFGVVDKEMPFLKLFLTRGQDNRITGSEGRDFYIRAEKLDQLAASINALGHEHGVVILDTLSRFHGGEENNAELKVFVEAMEYLVRKTGWAVITSHHPSQESARAKIIDSYMARGGTVLCANTRRTYVFAKMSDDLAIEYGIDPDEKDDYRLLRNTGSNYGPGGSDQWFKRQLSGVLMPVFLSKAAKGKACDKGLQEKIVSFVAEHAAAGRYLARTQLTRLYQGKDNVFGVGDQVLRIAVDNMIESGQLAEIVPPDGANLWHGDRNVKRVLVVED